MLLKYALFLTNIAVLIKDRSICSILVKKVSTYRIVGNNNWYYYNNNTIGTILLVVSSSTIHKIVASKKHS